MGLCGAVPSVGEPSVPIFHFGGGPIGLTRQNEGGQEEEEEMATCGNFAALAPQPLAMPWNAHAGPLLAPPCDPPAGGGGPHRFAALVSSAFGSMQSSVGLRRGASGRRTAATVSASDVEMGGSLQALPFGLSFGGGHPPFVGDGIGGPADSNSGSPYGAYMPPILIGPAADTALAAEADRGAFGGLSAPSQAPTEDERRRAQEAARLGALAERWHAHLAKVFRNGDASRAADLLTYS